MIGDRGMKKGKRYSFYFLLIVTMCSILAPQAYAWSIDTNNFDVFVNAENMPNEAMYVDILFPIELDDPNYIEITHERLRQLGFSETSTIVTYVDNEGYQSSLLHFKYSGLCTPIKDSYFYDNEYMVEVPMNENSLETDIWEISNQYRRVKVAYLDVSGNILSVTNSARISNIFTRSFLAGQRFYKLKTDGDRLSIDMENGPPWWIFGVFVLMIPVAIIAAFIIFVSKYTKKIDARKRYNK
jgi:hypothetical protein